MKNIQWIKVWRKVKTSYTALLNEYHVSPVDVVKFNKKTGFVTWLDLR